MLRIKGEAVAEVVPGCVLLTLLSQGRVLGESKQLFLYSKKVVNGEPLTGNTVELEVMFLFVQEL